MIYLMEKYDLTRILTEIDEDMHYQSPDEHQQKDIAQQTITELMIENLKREQKEHD